MQITCDWDDGRKKNFYDLRNSQTHDKFNSCIVLHDFS